MEDIVPDDITQPVIELIAAAKSIPADTITPESTFDSLQMDSLDKINLSFAVEERFNIEIPDDALSSLKTVNDVVEGVRRLRQAKSAS